jgi:hypothetical protein
MGHDQCRLHSRAAESHGYDAIMYVIDSLTKRTHFIPMHTTINAESTALLFLKEV